MTRFALRQLRRRLARRAEQLIVHVQLAAQAKNPLRAREAWLERCGRDVAEALAELIEAQEKGQEPIGGPRTYRYAGSGV